VIVLELTLAELAALVAKVHSIGHSTGRPRRRVGVHHCWVCGAEVTQPYWLHPDRTAALPAVWWRHCETTWFDAPEQVRDDDRAAA